MRLAVIDCGTNTFHILVADTTPQGTFQTVHKERRYVRLGQEGLNFIGTVPFYRGLECLKDFATVLKENHVSRFRAFGTEALRRAANGQEFVEAAFQTTGIPIQIIDGEEEARLIHRGVMEAIPPFPGKALVMDIGGGSVEFIICDVSKVWWAKSFPVGVQVLYSGFQRKDPISQGDLAAIWVHLEQVLQPLIEELEKHQTQILIGASGSFEVIEDMILLQRPHPLFSVISVEDYYLLHGKILASSLEKRLNMPKLPPERAELIVVAFVLIDFVIRKAGIRQMITSAYAMKEGMMKEMLQGSL